MFKKLLIGSIFYLLPLLAQVSTTNKITTIKFDDGSDPAAYIYTSPSDTANDSVVYIKPFRFDLGGRTIMYGLNQTVKADTFTLKLALDGSVDNATWYAVDSISVTPQIVGQYMKNLDATLIRYPYWRLRYPVANTKLRGDTNGGTFSFFVQTNLKERH